MDAGMFALRANTSLSLSLSLSLLLQLFPSPLPRSLAFLLVRSVVAWAVVSPWRLVLSPTDSSPFAVPFTFRGT